MSPFPRPDGLGAPLPRNLNVFPSCVPAGIFKEIIPSKVGILTFAPNAASANVTGTSSKIVLPSRLKIACDPTLVMMYKSPGGPPAEPNPPLPLKRIFEPSFTPGEFSPSLFEAWRQRRFPCSWDRLIQLSFLFPDNARMLCSD